MSELVGNPKDRFSHDMAHILTMFEISQIPGIVHIILYLVIVCLRNHATAFKDRSEPVETRCYEMLIIFKCGTVQYQLFGHNLIMSPPARVERILFFPLHLFVCLSVGLSVCQSQNRVSFIT